MRSFIRCMIYLSCAMVLLAGLYMPCVAQNVSNATTCEPCGTSPGTQIPWAAVPEQNEIVTIGECSYTITLKIRTCPSADRCKEIKIEKITPNFGGCSALTPGEVDQLFIGRLIQEDMLGQSPPPGSMGGVRCWRILKPMCWRRVVSIYDCSEWIMEGGPNSTLPYKYPPGSIVPCDVNSCCLNFFWVQRDACDALVFLRPNADDYGGQHGRPGYTIQPYSNDEEGKRAEFDDLFKHLNCRQCARTDLLRVGGSEDKGGEQTQYLDNPCYNSCKEDIIGNYFNLLHKYMKNLTSGVWP